MTDFEYIITNGGMFYRIFPMNPEAEKVWAEMGQTGDTVIFAPYWHGFRARLKAAGYVVAKAQRCDMSLDDLLEELGAV